MKRSIQDPQPASGEPAAKRIAVSSDQPAEQRDLEAAQVALDRLDHVTVHQICTGIIDSNPSDPVTALLLRSVASEKLGSFQEAIEDAEKASNLENSRRTHLRSSFAHLALAHREMELAKMQDEVELESSPLQSNMELILDGIKTFRGHESGNPFRRVSSDLFNHIFSFLDSPSLSLSSAVCKKWRVSILQSSGFFRTFDMDGTSSNIIAGINLFSSRCGGSIGCIRLGVKNNVSQEGQALLKSSIIPSLGTIKELSIAHQGDLCRLILEIASQSPAIKLISSTRMGAINTFHYPSLTGRCLQWRPSYQLKLLVFVWEAGGDDIKCDETLLSSVQDAKIVRITSFTVTSAFVVQLLSSNSRLQGASIPWILDEEVSEMPASLHLPSLEFLRLHRAPRSIATHDSSLFLRSLRVSKTLHLLLQEADPGSLYSLGSWIQVFCTFGLVRDATTCELLASSFIKGVKDWSSLRALLLKLPSSTSTNFWNHLVRLLSPLSRENVEEGLKGHSLLPNLAQLWIGREDEPGSTRNAVSGSALANLVAGRLASSKGLSAGIVSQASAGDLNIASSSPALRGRALAQSHGRYSRIHHLDVRTPVILNDGTRDWLREHVHFSTK